MDEFLRVVVRLSRYMKKHKSTTASADLSGAAMTELEQKNYEMD